MRNALIVCLALSVATQIAFAATFKAGFGERDITPTKPMPMWGYGARHALPGKDFIIPLKAKTVVVEAEGRKLAIMGLDMGRSPTYASMDRIKKAVKEQAGVDWVLISGSHTHHGPVIELLDEEGYGKGKFDDCVAYAKELEAKIIEAIVEAAKGAVDAKMGWASEENTDLNRNRHSKIEPKPRDPELAVVRFDDLNGKPIALFVNLAAHPTIESVFDRRFSAEWPGAMQRDVEADLGIKTFFMQGAEGDMSPNTNEKRPGVDGFGHAVAVMVGEINKCIVTSVPAKPTINVVEQEFPGEMRIKINDPLIRATFQQMFFPEILAMSVEFPNNIITAKMSTALLNGELAMVGGAGEFFSTHSVRLKKESSAKKALFFGLCNGHCMYFPTRAAIEEGGYGADASVSWVPVGTGEMMMDNALENIKQLQGK